MQWILNGSDERLEDLWPGYVDLTDAGLALVLAAAAEACEAFQPKAAQANADDELPAGYVVAQALHAKALTRAGFVGGADQVGFPGEGVTVWPMDWQVKALLRPRTRPVVQ